MEEKNYTVKDYIIGGIFFIWFIGSIAALFMTVTISPWLALSVFGQYFLVFGFIVYSRFRFCFCRAQKFKTEVFFYVRKLQSF